MRSETTYRDVRTYESPGAIVRVYFPDLTEEERDRRMTAIQKQAANLLRKVEKNV